ncbi:MAG: phage/plasmid primase, P4 family [Thermoplasmata archaeon]
MNTELEKLKQGSMINNDQPHEVLSGLSEFQSTSYTHARACAQEVNEKCDNPDTSEPESKKDEQEDKKPKVVIPDNPFEPPSKYFEDERFDAAQLAADIVGNLHIITLTSTNEIFGWDQGLYIGGPEGENLLVSRLPSILGNELKKLSSYNIRELLAQVRLRSYRSYEIFETNLNLLPLRNGVLDIQTGVLEPYDKQKHFFLFQLPAEYRPGADCPKFKQFVSEVVYPQDVQVIQEIFGYCLWRDGLASIKKAIMLLGGGDNGKSLLLSILTELLGRENVSSISLSQLCENRFASAYLRGKLANIFPDLPDQALKQTGIFKGLVGDDLMPYEIKHGGQGKFLNRAKLIFAANKLPDAWDDSDAYYTRWQIVSFPFQFVRGNEPLSERQRRARDKNQLKLELTTPEELSGILNWALEGLRRLQRNGCFSNELSPMRMREEYIRLANSLRAFLLDQCEITASNADFVSKDSFYNAYVAYCANRKLIPFKKERIGKELPSYCPGKITAGRDSVGGSRVPTWRGVRLKVDDKGREDTE